MTLSLKLVVEWRRLPRFPAKMTLPHARALLYYSENLVLVVVLVLESKGLLIIQLRSIKVIIGTSEVQLRASSPVESLLAGYSEVRKPPTLILSVKWL